MGTPAIKVEGLWKEYVIGAPQRANGTFYDLLAASIAAPFRALRGRTIEEEVEQLFWAVNDVSFEVQPGEVVGIVGRNGAGKSTLLKILSRITAPSRGRVEITGRLASLLEVGTGFHPELSGRENIYLNGAILGMTRRDIARKFDEIVAFAEVSKFIDTPVKRYSSGMYVRLAFSVAAHLETDVLIVDEVLAVGDAEFQSKCLGKMNAVARGGRAVLLVSHNLASIRALCSNVVILEKGKLSFKGPTEEALNRYEDATSSANGVQEGTFLVSGPLAEDMHFEKLLVTQLGQSVSKFDPMLEIELEIIGVSRRTMPRVSIEIVLFREGVVIASCLDAPPDSPLQEGRFTSRFRLAAHALRPGRFVIGVGAVGGIGQWAWASDVAVLDVRPSTPDAPANRERGLIVLQYSADRIQ